MQNGLVLNYGLDKPVNIPLVLALLATAIDFLF
jgi:hypothetical protein